MLLSIPCPGCRCGLRVGARHRGRGVRCPSCTARFVVADEVAVDAPLGPGDRTAPAPRLGWEARGKACPDSSSNGKDDPPRSPSPLLALRSRGPRLAWPLLAPLLPLAIPLIAGGGARWVALGLGLSALCVSLLCVERWSLALRCWLVVALSALGQALALMGGAPPWLSAGPREEDALTREPLEFPRPLLVQMASRRVLHPGGLPVMPIPTMPPRPPQPPLLAWSVPEGPPERNSLQMVARLPRLLAMVLSPEHEAAFATTHDGHLLVFSYPKFELRGRYRLPQPTYHVIVDRKRDRLYAASAAPGAMVFGPLGDRLRARADLHAYDIPPLLDGSTAEGSFLRPLLTLTLGVHVRQLTLAPDGDCLCVAATALNLTLLGRVHLPTWGPTRLAPVSLVAGCLCLSPDGSRLYVGQAGRVVVVQTVGPRRLRDVLIESSPTAMVADDAGRVFLAENGRGGVVTVLDGNKGVVLGQWALPVPGRPYLCLSPDRRRLYLGSSGVAGNVVYALDVEGERAVRPLLLGKAGPTLGAPVRGENFVSPDGLLLINQAGAVFRLAPRKDEG